MQDLCRTVPLRRDSMADSYDGLEIRGYEHWYINNGACYNFWRESMGPMGCRLCVANCPYSRKDNWLHDFAAAGSARSTGITSSSLLWMQKKFFDHPDALDYRRPDEGGIFASYRPDCSTCMQKIIWTWTSRHSQAEKEI